MIELIPLIPRSSFLSVVATAALGAWAAISVGAGVRNALRSLNSQDLGPVYKSSRLWLSGRDPYAPYTRPEWEAICHIKAPPDLPVGVAFSTPYTPVALLNLLPVTVFGWDVAKRVWLGLNLVMALCVPYLIRRLWYQGWPTDMVVLFGLFWLGGIGLRVGLGNGQHTLLWFFCTLCALALLRNSRNFLSGVLLALAFHKVQIAATFVSLIVAKRRWRALAGAAISLALLLVLFITRLHAPLLQVWNSYRNELQWWSGRMKAGGLAGAGSTHLYPVLTAIISRTSVAVVAMYALAVLGLLMCVYLAYTRGTAENSVRDLEASGIMLLTLWAMYNGIYSTIVLIIPIAALYDRLRTNKTGVKWRSVLVICECGLALAWFMDARKVWGIFTGNYDLSRTPTSPWYVLLDLGYRAIVFGVFIVVVTLQLRERGSLGVKEKAVRPRTLAACA